jgi:hypothetical protein
MKRVIEAALLFATLGMSAQEPKRDMAVRVPDAETAVRLAEPLLVKTYGKCKIESEKPLQARLTGDIWIVTGTLWCSDGAGGRTHRCVGGTAEVKMRQANGKVLSIAHYK